MLQRIFLTGSTSYVGTKFIELYGNEFEILGVARSDKNHPVDLLDFKAVEKLYLEFKPDFILHLAADTGRDTTTSTEITKTNPAITQYLIDLALRNKTPFIFTSTEAVYGGKEQGGGYIEADPYKPRSLYGESKVLSEKQLIASDLPYLITRGHRHVGISKNFHNSKQFPDTLKALLQGRTMELDSHKLFTPVLINNICEIFTHYLQNDSGKQVIINVGCETATTFYNFILEVAKEVGIDPSLIKSTGNEAGWPSNSSLSTQKLRVLGYPTASYKEIIETIKADSV